MTFFRSRLAEMGLASGYAEMLEYSVQSWDRTHSGQRGHAEESCCEVSARALYSRVNVCVACPGVRLV